MKITYSIDYSEAKSIIDAIIGKIAEAGKAAVVVVADTHGEPIALARMDGAPISSIRIALNKAWIAARERKPTKEIGEKSRHPEKGFDTAWFGDPQVVGWGGGLPVKRDGHVVGSVAVSGLTQVEDMELAEFGAELVGSL